MRFLVKVIDEQVEKLEKQDDTVFINRLQTIITKELQKYNNNVFRSSISVRELAPNEIITTK